MSEIAYFKRQAKNIFKDYKIKAHYIDDVLAYYHYSENDFCLMKAQHIVSCMAGFGKWGDLLKASAPELELAKLLFDNRDKIPVQHWKKYISGLECDLGITLDAKSKLEIFQHDYEVTNGGTYKKPFSDYCLNQALGIVIENATPQMPKFNPSLQITSLPLSELDRIEFIETANRVFENIMWRIVPNNPERTRKIWNAEDYVDNMLTMEMLPISRDYAISLIDAFLVHHVLGLIKQADKMVVES